jgi:hypothetical protein
VERVVRLEPGTTKNDEARNLPLTTELYQTLAMQKSIRDAKFPTSSWVFFNEWGGGIGRFQRSWRTACNAAGLAPAEDEPVRLFHDLRRSGVRNLIRAGVPEAVAMRISGHKTRSVFERYNIVSEQRPPRGRSKTGNLRGREDQSCQSRAHFGHTTSNTERSAGKPTSQIVELIGGVVAGTQGFEPRYADPESLRRSWGSIKSTG